MKGHKGNHHGRKSGGRTGMVVSGNPDVLREAKGGAEHKKGGAVKMSGAAGKHRMDRPRPGRKRGGGVGADKSPLSSAHKVSGAETTGGQPD